mgnify:CR=1 FL=1
MEIGHATCSSNIEPIALASPVRAPHREAARASEVTCVSGVVWLTQAATTATCILQQGQSFILDRQGLAVVYAFKDAADRRRPGRPHHSCQRPIRRRSRAARLYRA